MAEQVSICEAATCCDLCAAKNIENTVPEIVFLQPPRILGEWAQWLSVAASS
jgi:hypothetical protein